MSSAATATAPLNDQIVIAVAQLVDDAQKDRRDPSHSDLEFEIRRQGLVGGDPNSQGQVVGKAKRLRAVLSWAIENEPEKGGKFITAILGVIRGYGGFREASPNYVGKHAVDNCAAAFDGDGYVFGLDGTLRPKTLDNLTGIALTAALRIYVTRAKRGAEDAALLVGTGKDLLEAVAAHVVQQKFGGYASSSNFPTLLGQAFVALGLATPEDIPVGGEAPQRRVERAMYELACAVNQLRNRQGTGHGRPWLPSVTPSQAHSAVESMGLVAELLLSRM